MLEGKVKACPSGNPASHWLLTSQGAHEKADRGFKALVHRILVREVVVHRLTLL